MESLTAKVYGINKGINKMKEIVYRNEEIELEVYINNICGKKYRNILRIQNTEE